MTTVADSQVDESSVVGTDMATPSGVPASTEEPLISPSFSDLFSLGRREIHNGQKHTRSTPSNLRMRTEWA